MRRHAHTGDIVAGEYAATGPVWRLDPFALPVRYSAVLAGRASEAAIILDRDHSIVSRMVAGVEITSRIEIGSYDGVAVRFEVGPGDEEVRVVVELRHSDPTLTLPLAIAADPAEIAADWQAFARRLGLPMLLVRADGRVEEPVRRTGALTVADPKPRRRHAFFADRRPRFLVRRKVGMRRPADHIHGRELIARH